MTTPPASRSVVIAAIIAVLAFATAAVLFVQGDTSLQRLGLLFGLFGVVVPTLLSVVKADAAAKSTDVASQIALALNGGFEARVRHSARQVRDETPGTPRTDAHAESDAQIAASVLAAGEGGGSPA